MAFWLLALPYFRMYNRRSINRGDLKYEKGFEIKGLENFEDKDGYYCFHAGTKRSEDGRFVTNGGRVLGVTAKGSDLKQARKNAYAAAEWVEFENKYMRHDIGKAIDEA